MVLLNDLALEITAHCKTITELLTAQDLPHPSFAVDGPIGLPSGTENEKLQEARIALIDAAAIIHHLAIGPDDWIKWQALTLKHDQMVLGAMAHFNIFAAVPLDGEISYAAIAAKTNLAEGRVRRILRHAMTNHIFKESRPGYVVHTATSAVPVRNPSLISWIGHNIDEVGASSTKMVEAMERWGDSEDLIETGYGLAFGVDQEQGKGGNSSFFKFLQDDGEGERKGWRMQRLGEAMESMKGGDGTLDVAHVHNGFDWEGLGKATVVDIGGSVGHMSIEIAKEHPNLTCIVQDYPDLMPKFAALLPASLSTRVSFQAHDMFTPQPIKGADVYFLRYVLHDWPDSWCVKILEQILPAVKSGSKIIVMEGVMEPMGGYHGSKTLERLATSLDLQVMTMMNAKERTEKDWRDLFQRVSSNLVVKAFVKPKGSAMSVIELGVPDS